MSERRRILVVEDEYMIATDLAHQLDALGAEVVGPVGSLPPALAMVEAERDLSGAILDVNLNGDMVFPLVDALAARGVPVVFATGYDDSAIPTRYAGIERCEKPVTPATLKKAIAIFDAPV